MEQAAWSHKANGGLEDKSVDGIFHAMFQVHPLAFIL
jgi:hypothetical protein